MTIEIGYKVVRVWTDTDLLPADIYKELPTTERFIYHPNLWMERKTSYGPFSLFTTLQQAIDFKEKMEYPTRIYKCTYVTSEESTLYHPVFTEDQNGLMESGFPTGTVFADMVKLDEELKTYSDV